MELERDVLVSPTEEVPVIEGDIVTAIRTLADRGVGKKTIAREVGVALNTVRRYLRQPPLATVRVETPPGDELQIDFGQKRLQIAGVGVRIVCLVAVLSDSHRLFVKAFLNQRGADWCDGIAAALTHFGGVPRTLLGDNARLLVQARDRATGTVVFQSAYLAFCRDCDVQPRACAPYRARTKGKTEAGVKYVKRNALAHHAFASLERHLAAWMPLADQRRHGTTREAPMVRFDRDERAQLRPLPTRALPRREQRLRRRVALAAACSSPPIRSSRNGARSSATTSWRRRSSTASSITATR